VLLYLLSRRLRRRPPRRPECHSCGDVVRTVAAYFFANEYQFYIPPACKSSLFLRSTDGDNHGNDCNALSTLGLATRVLSTVEWRCPWHKKATETMILRYNQSALLVRAINASTNASTNEGTNASTNEGTNASTNEGTNASTNERFNERRMIERTNDQTLQRTND